MVSELFKSYMHRGEQPQLYFWRDTAGHEMDIVIDRGDTLIPIEIKSAQTFATGFLDNLVYWRKLSGTVNAPAALIYGGNESFRRSGVVVRPWFAV